MTAIRDHAQAHALQVITRLLLAIGIVMPMLAGAATKTPSLMHAGSEAFQRCTRDAGIDDITVKDTVRLAPQEYLLHDDGNRWNTAPSKEPRKKLFHLDTAASHGAKLYIYGSSKGATCNGAPLTFTHLAYGQWHVADIAAATLKTGDNIILFPAGASPPIDIGQKPQFSFSSPDGGKTWTPIDGELMVHLALLRHPAQGVLTSEVLDLLAAGDATTIRPVASVKAIRLTMNAETPAGTAITLEARTGNTLQPDASWSAWLPATRVKNGRYLQWRATLRTKDRLRTPMLKSVTVQPRLAIAQTPAWTIVESTSPEIVRSSFPFTYQAPSPRLTLLRERWKLDEVIAPGKTEMERYLLLRNWVRKQWPHNEGQCMRPWDAINILNAPAGDHGMCVHFGVTYTQCALALGFNARQIILRNHYVSEIWSNTLRRWVLMDVESVQPEGWDRYGTAIYLGSQGQLLNGLDIHRYLVAGKAREMTQILSMTDKDGIFADYARKYDAADYRNFERFGFPLRNDYLDNPTPWEEYHGVWSYHSNDYVWWSDRAQPDSPEYSRYATRAGDLYWTLNQAAVTLTATGDPNVLAVSVDTVTPNLRGFRYRVNEGPWQFTSGTGDSTMARQAYISWKLDKEHNTLEVIPQNLFERDGIPTIITVTPVK